MCQINVERVIGLLATDEALRRRFVENPQALLQALIERGVELSPSEMHALALIDSDHLARFADALDPRLQKVDLRGSAGLDREREA